MITTPVSNESHSAARCDTLTEKQLALVRSIKRCIWLYFWLLIFEGAVRKWVLPMFANPILLIRDPIVVWIYIQALRGGLFPHNLFLRFGGILAWVSLIAGLVAIQGNFLVVIYGFRTDFLQIPLIFIMGSLFNKNDVQNFGKWILIIAIPMTLLMAVQFKAAPNAWINAGSDESFTQIGALNYTRAPGTFSFISGPIYFYSLAAAFLMEGLFSGRAYPKWLTITSALAVGLAPVVSGSRTFFGNIVMVLAFAIIAGTILQPRLLLRTVQGLCIGFVVIIILGQLPVFKEGTDLLADRFANSDGGVQQGFVYAFCR